MYKMTENYWKYIEGIADDIMAGRDHWSEDDLHDIAHQHADGSQLVIYYSQAHDFVRWLPSDVRNQAEDSVSDCFPEQGTYDETASRIAYFALEQMIMEEVTERLEKESKAEELEEAQKAIEVANNV
tara:strand:- start:1551 stop:1931 length:381 start_codon:yes stop_codon:yes gene_type:complete